MELQSLTSLQQYVFFFPHTASDHQLKMQSYPRLEINFQSINITTDIEHKNFNTFYKYAVSYK